MKNYQVYAEIGIYKTKLNLTLINNRSKKQLILRKLTTIELLILGICLKKNKHITWKISSFVLKTRQFIPIFCSFSKTNKKSL